MQQIKVESLERPTLFELIDDQAFVNEQSFEEEAATIAYNLGAMAMKFARVERVPRYDEHSRENDAEHSFMLSLVATELAATYYSNLDVGLVAQFSIVHDLIELQTSDVATFTLDDSELAAKEASEHREVPLMAQQLPLYLRQLFLRYEAREEPEARLPRLIDKMLPLISNIAGPGEKVMIEDYAITTGGDLDTNEERFSGKLRERFPDEDLEFIHRVRDVLAAWFSEKFAVATATA